MSIAEFKKAIQSKSFRSTDQGFVYKFIPENTLQANGSMAHMVHYSLEDDNGVFTLHHNSFFGTEPLRIELISETTPITFALTSKISNKFHGTWVEIESY